MGEVNVLAVGPCGPDLLFAEVCLGEGCRQLQCGTDYLEAAEFLNHHPGALIVCEGWQDAKWDARFSKLVAENHPSALILYSKPGESPASVEVLPLGSEEPLRELVRHPEVIEEIQSAWVDCRNGFLEFTQLSEQGMRLPLM